MKAYKLEILIIDHDELGMEGIKGEIENTNYANDCISPYVMNMVEKDKGEWSDEHPLNLCHTWKKEYQELFGKE